MRTEVFPANELILVSPAPKSQPLIIGDRVCLNSGGPTGLVVDLTEIEATIAWKIDGQIKEHTLPQACLRKVR